MARRKRKDAGLTPFEVNTYEVEWYRKHGKYPDERIQVGNDGQEYVVHDWTWNRANHYRRETIKPQLNEHVAFRHTGIRR